MAIVKLLEEVKTWLEKEVCENFTFKNAPDIDSLDGDDYKYELVKPKAFLMYPPPSEKFPSITVQFGEGSRQVKKKSGELKLRFLFATWNPGTHYINENQAKQLDINHEGWRDVWNFIDWTMRKLSNSDLLGPDIRIKHEEAITFGPMTEQDTMANYYPHWCAWIQFTIQYGVNSTNDDYSDLI